MPDIDIAEYAARSVSWFHVFSFLEILTYGRTKGFRLQLEAYGLVLKTFYEILK